MATVPEATSIPPEERELHSGDRMTREEFHRIYERTPEDFRAELIGGIVYVASPLRIRHGTNHLPLGAVFFAYESRTPGTESGDNTTILLGEEAIIRLLVQRARLEQCVDFPSHLHGSTVSVLGSADLKADRATRKTNLVDVHRESPPRASS